MRKLKTILIIINLKTAIITTLAVVSTWLCTRYNILADFPMTLLATAVVFPIVFSIGGAYKRREAALARYGSIKAHGRAIYFAARDWLPDSGPEVVQKMSVLLGELLAKSKALFQQPVDQMTSHEEEVYRIFSRLSSFIRTDLRERGLASGEVSRCNQYLSKMILAFEDIKHIYQYRTPRTLSSFSDLFVSILPILYGPYFAAIAKDYTPGLEYVMPVLFTTVLVSLDNIQAHLENPFDQIGEDDVEINAEKFVERLLLE